MAETARRGKTPVVLLVVAVVLLGIPLGAWSLRGAIATSMAEDELARQGITCDERFAVDVGALFGSASVGPTRCSREGGLVDAFELLGPLEVDLDGFEPTAVRAESVRLVLRDRDVRNGDGWAAPLARLELEQSVAGLAKGLSELSGLDLPPITVGQVEVSRGGAAIATASGVSLGSGSPMRVSADRILFSGPMGLGRLELDEVHGTATSPRVQLAGRATVSAGVGILGAISARRDFTLDALGLDTATPRFRLGGGL